MNNIELLIGNVGNIDFGGAIELDSKTRDKILEFLNTIYLVIEKEPMREVRNERLGDKLFVKKWTELELEYLLSDLTTEELSEKLGRTWMSVDIKRGQFYPKFLMWCDEKGHNIITSNTKDLIKEFMKEKHDEIIKRRLNRTKKKQIIKQIEELNEILNNLDSPKKRQEIEFLQKFGNIKLTVEEYLEEQRNEILSEIEMLQEELEE
jgi:hypothetical protein